MPALGNQVTKIGSIPRLQTPIVILFCAAASAAEWGRLDIGFGDASAAWKTGGKDVVAQFVSADDGDPLRVTFQRIAAGKPPRS